MRKYLAFVMLTAIIFIFSTNKAQAFVFGSDVHPIYDESNNNLVNLHNLLSFMYDDAIGLVGDNVRRASASNIDLQMDYYVLIYRLVQSTYHWQSLTPYLSKGNHDLTPNGQSTYKTYNFNYADYGDWPGEYDNADFEVFAISSDYFANATTPSILDAWLTNQRSNGKVKVIMSHYPLHTKRIGSSAQAQTNIYNIIDYWTKDDNPARTGGPLDIVFVWGHNHDADLQQSENIDKIAGPGEKMAISYNSRVHHANANEILNFTYLNAGFVLGDDDDDGGHMSQIIPFAYCLYIIRYGENGSEESTFIIRKNVIE